MNNKYEIIKNDFIQIKHPGTRDKIIRLFRIISLRDLTIKVDKDFFKSINPSDITYLDQFNDTIVIPKHTIGGYIESESNLDIEDESWIHQEAKVFDNSKITSDSYIFGSACILGNITVEKSIIGDFSRLQNGFGKYFQPTPSEKITVHHSILLDRTLINNLGDIYDSIFLNSARAYGEFHIHRCFLKDGAYVFSSTVRDSTLIDQSCIQVSNSNNVHLSGRISITKDVREDFMPNLQIVSEEIKS